MLVRTAASVVLLDGWRRTLLAVAAGAVATLGLAPFNVPLAAFLAFPLLVLMLDGAAGAPGHGPLRRLAPAFGIGWAFGFGYFVAGLWWLGAAMTTGAGSFLWAIPFAVLVLPAILALYFGLAAALARLFWSPGMGRILALAASFALFEVLRGRLFTGFPWNEIGVIAAPVPLLMQSVALIGLHGLTLVAVYVFAAPALLLDPGPRRAGLSLALVLALAHVGYGAVRLLTVDDGPSTGIDLRLVQPNILQDEKWDEAEANRIFDRLIALTAERPSAPAGAAPGRSIIIWPESSVPFILTERPDALARIAETLQPGEILVVGAVRVEAGEAGQPPRYTNSLVSIGEDGGILDAGDKVHLVPFGEYLPYQSTLESFGLRQLAELPGGFTAGTRRVNLKAEKFPEILPLICYEIIFQDEIEADGPDRAGVIVNVTNDAWYGRTPGPYQHLRQAELTAVALGLPLVRSANTGISIVNDAYGKTSEALGLGSSGVIHATLPAALSPTVFARHGNGPFWLLFAGAWVVCIVNFWIASRKERLTPYS